MEERGTLAQKNAVRYRKIGAAAYHSHHDLIRFWERAVRRAELPVRSTQGFNPHPRLVFLHALGVGVASLHEEVELEFFRRVPAEDIAARLKAVCGDVLVIDEIVALPAAKKGRTAKEFRYTISGWGGEAFPVLPEAVSALLAAGGLLMRRGAPGMEKTVDIRPYIRDLRISAEGVEAVVMNTPAGSARPDEIAKALAEKCGADVSRLVVVKTGMALAWM